MEPPALDHIDKLSNWSQYYILLIDLLLLIYVLKKRLVLFIRLLASRPVSGFRSERIGIGWF